MFDFTSEEITSLISIPPSEWQSTIEEGDSRTDSWWNETAEDMECLAVRLLLLSEYIQQRKGNYCGDKKDHETAAKAVKKRHKAIRKALEFTVPDAGLLRL